MTTDDEPDPKSLTKTELRSRIILLNEAASSSDDPIVRGSFQLQAAPYRARLAVINARETQEQDAQPADDPAALRAEIAAVTRERDAWRSMYERAEEICGRAVAAAAGLPPPAKPAVQPFSDVVREVVREAVGAVLDQRKLYIVRPQQPTMNDIALEAFGHGRACDAVALQGDDLQAAIGELADHVATALAAPMTDADRSMFGAWAVTEDRTVMLRWARELFAKQPGGVGIRHSALADEMVNEAIGVSAPEVTIDPLPGVIQCNEWSAGCRSTIDRDALPGGWVLSAGLWICPLCQKRAPC